MPELPEVETIRKMLIPVVQGATIAKVEVFYKPMIHSDLTAFIQGLQGKTFTDVTRIGKFLIFHLSESAVIVSHLRMEGRFIELPQEQPHTRFSRLVFSFTDGRKLCYDDSRCFGTMELTDEHHYRSLPSLTKLGPEPFDVPRSSYLYAKINRSSRPIKQLLLDQTILAGLGNIYVDEVLFRCRIHPLTPGNILSKDNARDLLKASKAVLNQAIEAGGSTVRTYHAMNGIDGLFQTELLAYGNANKPCSRCGASLKKIQVGGRGTTYCPRCQKDPTMPLLVGITGKIASGKSTVLNLFQQHGFETFSSDAIVHQLYLRKENRATLEKAFGPSIIREGQIDRPALASIVRDAPRLKRKLEKIVHPWVEAYLLEAIRNSTKKEIAVEVPLLYEAHMEYLFDAILAISVTAKTQKRNLLSRGAKNISEQLLLNANNAFTEYVKKADFVVKNNGTPEDLKQSVETVILKIRKKAQRFNTR